MSRFDYVIAGGGLQAGLITLAVRHFQPGASIALFEAGDTLGGNHTWSFHALDVPPEATEFVEPLVSARWPGYMVRFPGDSRQVPSAYATISSDQFARVVSAQFDGGTALHLRRNAEVLAVEENHVTLGDGSVIEGLCVIDARGPAPSLQTVGSGFQKFLGLEVETEKPWPDRIPTLMDATVRQDDGYRFLYTLPFDAHRVLVEDTYFSDSPVLDRRLLRERVVEFLKSRAVESYRVVREESGVLPMPWSGVGPSVPVQGPIAGGAGGGWYHPATGYSFAMALRLAVAIAHEGPRGARTGAIKLAERMRRRQGFGRFLNRLLFGIVVPQERWQVFRRLYRDVPDSTMARFYAMEFTKWDAARMVVGWPPPLAPLRLFPRLEVSSCPSPLR